MNQAFAILDALKGVGVTVRVIPPDTLRLEPASKIPADLLSQIREAKPEILQILARPTVAVQPTTCTQKAQPAIACRYDWQPGYRGLRLHCTLHPHASGTATVFRMPSSGRDVLLEMGEQEILTGQAQEDAARVN
jgi:hypothetical protein